MKEHLNETLDRNHCSKWALSTYKKNHTNSKGVRTIREEKKSTKKYKPNLIYMPPLKLRNTIRMSIYLFIVM